jgi:hypothetical protein
MAVSNDEVAKLIGSLAQKLEPLVAAPAPQEKQPAKALPQKGKGLEFSKKLMVFSMAMYAATWLVYAAAWLMDLGEPESLLKISSVVFGAAYAFYTGKAALENRSKIASRLGDGSEATQPSS